MIINKDLIYDIGMHRGKDTEFYLKKGFRVIGVEANPLLAQKVREKLKSETNSGELIIIEKAISDISGTIDFYVNDIQDDWGSIYPSWNEKDTHGLRKISVPTIRLEELLNQHGVPYYMKIDIEGSDIVCLKELLNYSQKPQYISCELLAPHNLGSGIESAIDIICYLRVLGYSKFKISDQPQNKFIQCLSPAIEGNYVNHSFDGECSGLFGKELPGEWINIDWLTFNYLNYFHEYIHENRINYLRRVINKYLGFNLHQKGIFPKYGWYDIHATF